MSPSIDRFRRLQTCLALLLLAATVAPHVAAAVEVPAVPADELAARRAAVAAALGPDSLLVLVAPEPAPRNGDVSWPFRQDDDLFWLTGVALPESALALVTGPAGELVRSVLFAPEADPDAELWTGPLPSFDELRGLSGIDEVAAPDALRPFLAAALSGRAWGESDLYRYYRPPALPAFSRAVAAGRATLWLGLGSRGFDGDGATGALELARQVRDTWPEVAIANATPLLVARREIKSQAEVALLERAIAITEEGIRAGMRRALSAERENQVQATIEHAFRDLGACCWGFPSIVAAGANTTILHYEAGEDPIGRDDLVLLDVGADFHGYTADVTRTFPADGTFSADQRAVYQAVLDVWEAMLPRLVAGTLYADVHRAAVERMGEELLALGLVTANVPEQVTLYFPHGLGHPLGLAVHDVFDRTRPLEPGMVWSLEPGLYVRPGDVTASDAFAALTADEQARVRSALDR
ncbi:MAG TPA: Xaa-Pro aminopeptidase, partial [Thermoanaerobaculia bacterium]|nr:Xaa-Pro aminopeptidase [Thermoanaerobaculia bacterium]